MKAVGLKENDRQALKIFKDRIAREFPDVRLILFGSKVRSQDEEFSDIDVLVLLNRKVTTDIERGIFDIGFEVGLEFEVVFGIVVEESKFWNSSLNKAIPFYQNVVKEGVAI